MSTSPSPTPTPSPAVSPPKRSSFAIILLITFIESFATILLERGVHFYTEEVLGYSESDNLWLGLALGISYIVGAFTSHPIADRIGERRLISLAVLGALAIHVTLMFWQDYAAFITVMIVTGMLSGWKWPVIESYIAAGRTPKQQARAIAMFNVSWATSVPLALVAVGLLVDTGSPMAIFLTAAICNAAVLALLTRINPEPIHLEHDHPERPVEHEIAWYQRLLSASRWTMLGSYALLFLLSPLMPFIFADLGYDARSGAWFSSLMDVMRLVAFIAMGIWIGWHGMMSPIVVSIVAMPVGFVMILLGPNLATVIAGEIAFGLSSGICYYASLYYAMVVKNASVDAGGAHEGLIGIGFALGPMMGLLGLALGDGSSLSTAGVSLLWITVPFMLICIAGGTRSLAKRKPAPTG